MNKKPAFFYNRLIPVIAQSDQTNAEGWKAVFYEWYKEGSSDGAPVRNALGALRRV